MRSESGRNWLLNVIPRGVALFLGGFSLVNALGGLQVPGFDANLWWIDLRFLPTPVGRAVMVVSGICLIGTALRLPRATWSRSVALAVLLLLFMVALANTAQFYWLLARGALGAGTPIPLSLFIGASLAFIAVTIRQADRRNPNALATPLSLSPRSADTSGHAGGNALFLGIQAPFPPRSSGSELLRVLVVCLVCTILFPFAQMFCFGHTDYRRPADVAVVLGARVYADGHLSDALADRVRTASALYRQGIARKLIFSGGPGDGPISEPVAMKQFAVKLGVKGEDILLDEAGVNTQATVANTERLCAQLHANRILAVSHFYHLPRIKLAYQRDGWEVFTVPARETRLLGQLPYNMAREVAALWAYYWRPLLRQRTAAT